MRRILIVLLALALGACATYSHDRGGYYQADGYGDYYYSREPVVPYMGVSWYDPYDALFWGLRYSYFDPFWYPNFHYGVTFFPRYYYGWPYWQAGSYWSWRGYHPYSPYYGSYWDHYYHWQRPSGPRRPLHGGGRGLAWSGPERFGSARNAAERMAAGRGGDAGGPAALDAGRIGASTANRSVQGRPDVRQQTLDPGLLPSSRYAPRQSRAGVDGFQRDIGAGSGMRADGRQRGQAGDAYAPPQRADGARLRHGASPDYGFRADGRLRGPTGDAYAPTQRADSARLQRGALAPDMSRSGGGPPPTFRTPETMIRSAPPAPAAADTWSAPPPSARSAPEMPARSAPAPSRSEGERSSPRSRGER